MPTQTLNPDAWRIKMEDYERKVAAYEAKIAAKKKRLEERAEAAEKQSQAFHKTARSMAARIPFGQPIHVGHHSERADRRYRERIYNAFDKAFQESKKAQYYANKAESVGEGGISSDDPAAIQKLKAKLNDLEAAQVRMKTANKIARSKKTTEEQKVVELTALGYSEENARAIMQPSYMGKAGFAPYQLTNNNANIARTKKRIEELESLHARDDVEEVAESYTYREDVDDNRIHFIFEGKPSEDVRSLLKKFGFKWSPVREAWVRKLNGAGIYAAEQVKRALE